MYQQGLGSTAIDTLQASVTAQLCIVIGISILNPAWRTILTFLPLYGCSIPCSLRLPCDPHGSHGVRKGAEFPH